MATQKHEPYYTNDEFATFYDIFNQSEHLFGINNSDIVKAEKMTTQKQELYTNDEYATFYDIFNENEHLFGFNNSDGDDAIGEEENVADETDQEVEDAWNERGADKNNFVDVDIVKEKKEAVNAVNENEPEVGINNYDDAYEREEENVAHGINQDVMHSPQQSSKAVFDYIIYQPEKYICDIIMDLLAEVNFSQVMIYCDDKELCETIFNMLAPQGFQAAIISHDMNVEEVENIIEAFKAHSFPILISNDIPMYDEIAENVDLVINLGLPIDVDTYEINNNQYHGASVTILSSMDEFEQLIINDNLILQYEFRCLSERIPDNLTTSFGFFNASKTLKDYYTNLLEEIREPKKQLIAEPESHDPYSNVRRENSFIENIQQQPHSSIQTEDDEVPQNPGFDRSPSQCSSGYSLPPPQQKSSPTQSEIAQRRGADKPPTVEFIETFGSNTNVGRSIFNDRIN